MGEMEMEPAGGRAGGTHSAHGATAPVAKARTGKKPLHFHISWPANGLALPERAIELL